MGLKLPPELAAKCLALAGEGAAAPGGDLDRVVLPVPPSTNNLFVTRGTRRFKSPEYRAWIDRATPTLLRLRRPAAYPVRFRCVIGGTVNESRDWDNFVKPVQDLARALGVIAEDCLRKVHGGHVDYEPGPGEPTVTVWFEELTARGPDKTVRPSGRSSARYGRPVC